MAGKVQAGAASPGRGRGRRVSSTLAEINVVPLVDVMLVLLIIFMVTAPMIQRGIDVSLPVSRNSNTIEGERVFVTIPNSYKTDGMLFVNSDRLRVEAVADRIKQRLEKATDKQVYLRSDGAVQLQEFMAVLDRLKDAGVKNVAIVTKAPGDL